MLSTIESEDATPDWNSDNDTPPGSPATPFVPPDDELCDGYHDNNGERKCLGPCSGYLYFTNHDGTTFHFCKASHMMRYIVKHHTGKRDGDFTLRAMEIEEGHFEEMVGVPRRVFYKLTSHWHKHISKRTVGAPYALTPHEQVLLFFTRLRHYPVHSLAAHIFNITKPTAQNTAQQVTEFFFSFFLPFVTIGNINTRLRDSFRYYHQIITFILDGTEQPIHATNNIYQEGQYYSHKKKTTLRHNPPHHLSIGPNLIPVTLHVWLH